MNTITLEVQKPAAVMADFVRTWKSAAPQPDARIAFASPELLWQVLVAKRWELLKMLCGTGPISIREASRRVERDLKAVHSNLMALLSAGIVTRTPAGRIEFPFEAVRLPFLLEAA